MAYCAGDEPAVPLFRCTMRGRYYRAAAGERLLSDRVRGVALAGGWRSHCGISARRISLALLGTLLIGACIRESPPAEVRDPSVVASVQAVEPATPTSPDTVILTDGQRREFDRRERVVSRYPDPEDLMLSGELNGEPWIAFLDPLPPSPAWPVQRDDCYGIWGSAWRNDGLLHFRSTIRLPLADDFEPGWPGHTSYYEGGHFCVNPRGEVAAYLSN
jgi:hypothetical protein